MGRWRTTFRYAARTLLKAPFFTATAVLILGLGIGANASIFTVVNGVLLEPLPLPNADRLVALCERHPTVGAYCVGSLPNVADLEARGSTLAAAGNARSRTFSFEDQQGRLPAASGIATPGFWRALGVEPAVGRLFAEDEVGEDANVLLISHALWASRYGSDPEVVGRTISVDGTPHVIVGVLPEGLEVPDLEWIQIWRAMPFGIQDEDRRGWRGFVALGRLADGATLTEARAELTGIYRSLEAGHDAVTPEWHLDVESLKSHVLGDTRPTLLVFLGAVGLLLLIACANVANLLLVRSARRDRELAIRSALGAARSDLVGGVLAESALLSLAGCALGLLLAVWGTHLFLAMAPAGIPRLDNVVLNGRVYAFAFLLSLATVAIFGLIPALRTGKTSLAADLRSGRASVGKSGGRLRDGFVVAELALSLVLLTTAALVGRSFLNFLRWEPGFDRDGLAVVSVFYPNESYDGSEELVSLFRRTEQVALGVPGVTSVAMASSIPLLGGREGIRYYEAEQVPLEGEALPDARVFDVGPGYFATLGIPVLRGREFGETDDQGAGPVLVVNESFARRTWPAGEAVGRRLVVPAGDWGPEDVTYEVIGVVADVDPLTPGQAPEPEIYRSNRQYVRPVPFVVLRATADAAAVATRVSEAIVANVSPALTVTVYGTMDSLVESRLVRPRFNMALIGAFAMAAVLLTVVGVYSVLAYAVAQRQREMGVRMAMGSSRRRVLRTVLGDGLRLAVLGIVLGLVGVVAASGLVATVIYGIAPTDPATLAGIAVLVALLAAAASAGPALRASRVDPVSLLRQE